VNRKTILILWIVSFVIALVGGGMFVPGIVKAASTCTTTAAGTQNCTLPPGDPLAVLAGFGIIVLIAASIVGAVAWIGALIGSAKAQAWGWFVVVLIFSSLGTLIYALAGPPEQQPAPVGGYPPYSQYPPYPPYGPPR
jgi:hypothetical protein